MVETQIFVGKNRPSQTNLNPVRNKINSNRKPKGGFWTAPGKRNSLSSFERFESGSLVREGSKSWLIYPKGNTRVMRVESKEKLHSLPKIEGRYKSFLDFEAIFDKNQIDGIYLSQDLVRKKAFSDDYNLYSWDFETILWNNVSWIKQVKKLGDAEERVSELL